MCFTAFLLAASLPNTSERVFCKNVVYFQVFTPDIIFYSPVVPFPSITKIKPPFSLAFLVLLRSVASFFYDIHLASRPVKELKLSFSMSKARKHLLL